MFPFEPTTLTPLEVVAFSALCAVTVLSVGVSVAATLIYLSMRVPGVARQPVAARTPEPLPTGPIPPVVAMARAAG